MRTVLIAALAGAVAAAVPAQAATRLAPGRAELHALTVGRDGGALAVVDSGHRAERFRLVRSSGRGRRHVGLFGGRDGEHPDVAAARGGAHVSWGRPVSGGSEISTARLLGASALSRGEPAVVATGPARLGVYGGSALLAFPDELGDVALHPPARRGPDGDYDVGRRSRLTSDAPATRHHPVDVAVRPAGPLVLDLAQRRRRSSLIVVGTGAPRGAVVSVGALRHLQGAMSASRRLIAVAYLSRGRAVLATARPDGRWRRVRLPSFGRALDAPVPVVVGRRVHVVYAQGPRSDRDVVLATVSGRRVRARRLTRGRVDDRRPLIAAGGRRVFVGWSRRAPGARSYAPMLRRLR